MAGAAGIPLHLELHRRRDDIGVTVHSHPQFGTVWADLRRVPGCYDQSSALGGGELVLVDEYDGPVNNPDSASRAIAAIGTADMALLANHGVLVTAGSIRAAHQRAVALENRCRRAWQVGRWGPAGSCRSRPGRSSALRRRGVRGILGGHGSTRAAVGPGPAGSGPGG